MMHRASVLDVSAILLAAIELCAASNIGYFWHLTDVHLDPQYSPQSDPAQNCRSGTGSAGIFGDYLCDTPIETLLSALELMAGTQPSADFVVYTGDNPPHLPLDKLSKVKSFETIRIVSESIRLAFPGTPVFPVLGNHDNYPQDQDPPHADWIYTDTLAVWKQWITKESAQKTFLEGGFYTQPIRVPGGADAVALVLNSVMWYVPDKVTANMTDPADQFAWMERELSACRKENKKVMIFSHCPPGFFERPGEYVDGSDLPPPTGGRDDDYYAWFQPHFNKRYMEIIREYADVIVSQFLGHEHSDSFRVIRDLDGVPVGTAFVTPAVNMWKSSSNVNPANNPSVRLFEYDRDTLELLDYTQFWMNMTQSNERGVPVWGVEYRARDTYAISDLSPQSMASVLDSFQPDGSETFAKYFLYNSVSYDIPPVCNANCKRAHMCGIGHCDVDEFVKCREEAG